MIARSCGGLTSACVLSAAAFLAGCSSSTTPSNGVSSMSASSESVVCKSAEDLKASVTGLKDMNIEAGGTAAVSGQFTQIKQDFSTLKADAKGQYSAQADALSSALGKLGSSLDAAKASLNAGTLSALASSAGTVVTAGASLVTAVSSTC